MIPYTQSIVSYKVSYLEPPILVRNPDVQLAVETAEPPERGVDDVRSVGGRDNHHVRGRLDAVHQGQELGHDALFRLSAGLWKIKKTLRIITSYSKDTGLPSRGACHVGHGTDDIPKKARCFIF